MKSTHILQKSAKPRSTKSNRREPYPVAYKLAFVGKYVSEITSLTGKKPSCQLEYYPANHQARLITRTGKTQIDAFLKCVDAAIRATDKIWTSDGGDREVWAAVKEKSK